LQDSVERRSTCLSGVHGSQNLHFRRRDAEKGRQALGCQLHSQVARLLGGLAVHLVIVGGPRHFPDGSFAATHAVTVQDHHALRTGFLAEDARQPGDGQPGHGAALAAGDQILQDGARAHRRELVHVPHQEEMVPVVEPGEDLVHQPEVDHGGLVHNEHGLPQSFHSRADANAQVAVDRGGGTAGRGRQLLGGAPRRRTERIGHALRLETGDERSQGRRLACSRATGENADARPAQQRGHRVPLFVRQGRVSDLLHQGFRLARREFQPWGGRPREEVGELLSNAFLRVPYRRQVEGIARPGLGVYRLADQASLGHEPLSLRPHGLRRRLEQ